MPRPSRKIAALTAGFAVFAATLGGGVMMASADSTPTPAPSSTQQANPTRTPGAKDPKAYADDFIQKLAANLGIDPQTLKDALKKTSLDELDKLVADGTITQDQANKIKDAINNGATGGFGFRLPMFGGAKPGAAPNGGNGPRGGASALPFLGMGDQAAIATFLGTDVQTLRGELASGKSLAEVAQAHGKSRDDLKTFLTGQVDAALQKAVTAGKLTQAQADAIKANETSQIDHYIDATPPAFGNRKGAQPPKQPSTQPTNPSSGGA